MRKLMAIIMVVFVSLLICNAAVAGDVDARFSWTQPDYDVVNYWVLYWGDTDGGPYEVGSLQFDKTALQPDQSNVFTIPYPDGAKTTYYFVLVSFVDAEHYSGNSNQVPLEIDYIPIPGEPLQLQVTIIPE